MRLVKTPIILHYDLFSTVLLLPIRLRNCKFPIHLNSQSTAARFILGNYHHTASASSVMKLLSLSPPSPRHKIFRLRFFYKTLFVNSVLKQRLIIPLSYVSYRVGHSHKLGIPFCQANRYYTSFMPKTYSDWNALL